MMVLQNSTSNRHNAKGVPMSSFNQSVIKHKTSLLTLAQELGNVSKACTLMGFSRDTFYRYKRRMKKGEWMRLLMPTAKSRA